MSCMRLSSMIRDSTKVSVVTVDAVRSFDVLFCGVLLVYWGEVRQLVLHRGFVCVMRAFWTRRGGNVLLVFAI